MTTFEWTLAASRRRWEARGPRQSEAIVLAWVARHLARLGADGYVPDGKPRLTWVDGDPTTFTLRAGVKCP